MAPLTKRRWSTRRQGKKRATFVKLSKRASLCPNCHEPKYSHIACPKCGFYKGKKVINIKVKTKKKTP